MINENRGKVWTALCSCAFMMQFSVTNLVVILCQKHHSSQIGGYFYVRLFFFNLVAVVFRCFCSRANGKITVYEHLMHAIISSINNHWWPLNYLVNLDYNPNPNTISISYCVRITCVYWFGTKIIYWIFCYFWFFYFYKFSCVISWIIRSAKNSIKYDA